MLLADKRILVTGATGGIGTALCQQLEKIGVQLLLSSNSEESLNVLISKLDKSHDSVVSDISTPEGRLEIVKKCQLDDGIDGMINLAGIMDFSLFENQGAEIIEKTFQVNTLAPVELTNLLLPILKQKPEAVILNVGSTFGSIGHPGFSVYCASKAAIKTFSEALARELADSSINVSYVAPRATSTNFNSDKVNALNTALGNKADSPDHVAAQIINVLETGQHAKYLGWPEKLFVRINALMPGVVSKALTKNLKTIKAYANS